MKAILLAILTPGSQPKGSKSSEKSDGVLDVERFIRQLRLSFSFMGTLKRIAGVSLEKIPGYQKVYL